MLPFTVFDADGRIAGMTTYMNVDAANRRVEIGSTWYAKRVQRSALNTQCKLLLLDPCVRKLDCIAVEFRTHFFNHQSRRGIERLGAKQDGILRSHQVAPNGTLRDTVVYSIIAGEWPTVKAHLKYQLNDKAAVALRERDDGYIRLCDRGRGLRRLRAHQPAERRCRHQHLRARGRPPGLASLHPSAGGLHQDFPYEEHQLGLPAGAWSLDRRPQHLCAAWQDARRLVLDQRPHLQSRPAPGFRHMGAARQSRLGLSGRAAVFQADGAAHRRGRGHVIAGATAV